MIDRLSTIHKLYPEVAVTRNGVPYDENGNVVSIDETAVQKYVDDHAYIAKRAAEYPPYSDYLDGVVKGNQTQIDAYIAACQAVKTKYPKPE
jgi:hypothetical protein